MHLAQLQETMQVIQYTLNMLSLGKTLFYSWCIMKRWVLSHTLRGGLFRRHHTISNEPSALEVLEV